MEFAEGDFVEVFGVDDEEEIDQTTTRTPSPTATTTATVTVTETETVTVVQTVVEATKTTTKRNRVPVDPPSFEELEDDIRERIPEPLRIDGEVLLLAVFGLIPLLGVYVGIRRL